VSGRVLRTPLRAHGSSVLVATLSSAFGVALLQVTGVLSAVIRADDVTGSSATVAVLLVVLAVVFIVIAVYVGAVVTANTFATIIAGRTRQIALLRLVGAGARGLRRTVASEGLLVGVVGAVLGALVGTGVAAALAYGAVAADVMPAFDYSWAQPVLLLPIVAVALVTWLASWVGSRRVLAVTPLEAIAGSQERSRDEVASRPARRALAIGLAVAGLALLGLALVLGLVTPLAVLIGMVGGVLSFTGVVLGADLVIPPALRLSGRLLGGSAPTRLAAENAVRHPERSARATIGLVIGVTLVTMFGVAIASFRQLIHAAQQAEPEVYQGIDQMLDVVTIVFSVLVGFSALIAAVGLVNNLSLSVLQRTRELGLLRALGFSAGQLRRMILAESAQLVFTAVVIGLVLGAFYGWVGAQSLLGSINGSPGVVLPGVPWLVVGVIVLAAALLTAIASWAPARRAVRVSPIAALAVE